MDHLKKNFIIDMTQKKNYFRFKEINFLYFHQASVYLISHSCNAGKHSLRPSNVSSLKFVLFKLSFLNCFIALIYNYKFKKRISYFIWNNKKNSSYRQGTRDPCRLRVFHINLALVIVVNVRL
jgi:hypothetical protein